MIKHLFFILSAISFSFSTPAYLHMTEADQLSKTETQKYTVKAYNEADLFEENVKPLEPPNFTRNSVLSTGDIYKLEISETGIHKLDHAFLSDFLDVSVIQAGQIKIYGHPGGPLPEEVAESGPDDLVEIPLFSSSENQNQVRPGDFFLFYAEGPDEQRITNNNIIESVTNIYSRSAYVFLKISSETGQRMQESDNIEHADSYSSQSDVFEIVGDENINLLGAYSGTQGSGQQWFDRILTNQRTFQLGSEFDLSEIDISEPVRVDMIFAGRSDVFSEIQLVIDGKDYASAIGRAKTGDVEATYARLTRINELVQLSQSKPTITLTYPEVSSPSEGWLDYISLQYKRELVNLNTPVHFSDFESLSHGISGFRFSTNFSNPGIWDITNPMSPIIQAFKESENSIIQFGYDSSILRHFIAFDSNNIDLTPNLIGQVPNQNIHGIEEADMLIVYHPDFEEAALALAAHRTDHDNLVVHAIGVDKIYNEFSAGKQDPSAIRNLAKMMFERSDRFNYVLLLGDGSYDYLGTSPGLDNQSFVPAYETRESLNPLSAFPTDDYYALMNDNEGGNLRGALDIAVGRIPVKTAQEANQVVSKIIAYDTNPERFGDWRLRVAFAADDEDSNIHLRQADGIANTANQNFPTFNQEKIYFDSYIQESTPGGARYPAANKKLNEEIFNGLLVTNYLGHGGPKGWSQERVLKVADIIDWKNSSKLPLIITATCSFTGFDDPAIVTAGEEAILNPFGGAVALFSTVRSVYSSQNERLTKSVFDTIFTKDKGQYLTIGEVLRRSKNSNAADTLNVNARKFLLIGDPSMKLALPRYDINTLSINNRQLTNSTVDTLEALQEVHITGEIVDELGNRVSDFNGIVYPTLFDKTTSISTLANDGSSRKRDFSIQRSRLFKGSATVTAGEFAFSFTIPIDIDYAVGTGKLSFYATDGENLDAAGYYSDFYIGGSSNQLNLDDNPPQVNAFLNTFNFTSGDKTSSDPLLLVKLSDDFGINFTGISIGHDITAVLDGNSQNTIILNEFYTSDLDNSRQGTVRYPLSDIEPGVHRLTVKAFDVANNAAEQTIEFEVISPDEGEIRNLSSFPNPMDEVTTFSFEHDFVNESIQNSILIYDLSGRLVRTIQSDELALSGLNQSLQWDGKDSFGSDVVSGIYLYTVKINSPSLNISKESTFEKVVVIK